MVPGAGIEPARCYHRGILSPLRLPISPPRHTTRWAFTTLPIFIMDEPFFKRRSTTTPPRQILRWTFVATAFNYHLDQQVKMEAGPGVEPR